MERTAFIRSLVATAGVTQLTHVLPVSAAIDEAAVGREVFAQLREDGELLFDSPFYEHLNEIGSVISQSVTARYPYPIRYYIVRGDSANAFSVPGGNIYVNEPLLRIAKNRDELAGVLAHETGHMVLHHVAQRMAALQKKSTAASIGSILAQIVLGGVFGTDERGDVRGQRATLLKVNLAHHSSAFLIRVGRHRASHSDAYNLSEVVAVVALRGSDTRSIA